MRVGKTLSEAQPNSSTSPHSELSPQSAEILFEVYDRPIIASDPPKFLGLGLVGIDELAVGPASTQLLPLQPRPYETQPVAGAITVDFVFIEGAEIPIGARPQRLKEALRLSTPAINEHIRNGADLADAAVRALQDGALSASTGGQPSKSTLIIHSVQRVSVASLEGDTITEISAFPCSFLYNFIVLLPFRFFFIYSSFFISFPAQNSSSPNTYKVNFPAFSMAHFQLHFGSNLTRL